MTETSTIVSLEQPASEDVWHYHPRHRPQEVARVALSPGRFVVLGQGNRRWVENASGVEEFAAHLVPDKSLQLVSVIRVGTEWVYATDGGMALVANSALGAFRQLRIPSEGLSGVRGADGLLLGIRANGELTRSRDGGGTWQPVRIPALSPTSRFAQVALRTDGSALALSIPEQLWSSHSEGSGWKRIDALPVGTRQLQVLDQQFVVSGALVDFTVDAHGHLGTLVRPKHYIDFPGSVTAQQRYYANAKHDLQQLPLRPSALALRSGRAVFAGERYLEIIPLSSGGAEWALLEGSITGNLIVRSLPELAGQADARLSAFDRWIDFAYTDQGGGIWHFLRSEDGGRTFARQPYRARTPPRWVANEFQMVTAKDGALVVSGMCETFDIHCYERGIFYRAARSAQHTAAKKQRRGGVERQFKERSIPWPKPLKEPRPTSVDLVPAAAAPLKVPNGLAISRDGSIVYAIGLTDSKGAAVFVSQDSGRHFAQAAQREALLPWQPATHAIGAAQSDGKVAFVLEPIRGLGTTPAEQRLLFVDRGGHLVREAHAPFSNARIGAVGEHAIAIDPEAALAQESLDSGATWRPFALPPGLCSSKDCKAPVYCVEALCVFDDDFLRNGWGPNADCDFPHVNVPPHPSRVTLTPAPAVACTPDDPAWHDLPGVTGVPTAHEAALGPFIWSTTAVDPQGAAFHVSVPRGSKSPIYDVLLRPLASAADHVVRAQQQVGGAVAWRFKKPAGRENGTPSTRNVRHPIDVELAWRGVNERKIHHAIIKDLAPTTEPDVLRVTAGGLYVAFDPNLGNTWFLDGQRVVTIPPISWPKPLTTHDYFHVGSEHVALSLVGGVLIRARPEGSTWTFDAATIGQTPSGSSNWFRAETRLGFMHIGPRSVASARVGCSTNSAERRRDYLHRSP